MKSVTTLSTPGEYLHFAAVQCVYKCANCELISIATDPNPSEAHIRQATVESGGNKYNWDENTEWLPKASGPRQYPDVPEHIASAATEAAQCLTGGTYRAVGGLTRAVIEAIGKDQNFTMSGIAAKIDAMAEARLLRPLVAEQAHEIRHFGNNMAHGDFATPTTKEEAEEIITLMDEVLREVYQAPAQLARVKKAREKKADTRTEGRGEGKV